MAELSLTLLIVIVLALLFDFSNGWHDSANAIATVVSTQVLSPLAAVLLAGVLNVAGAFMSTAVAKMVGGGIVHADLMVFAGGGRMPSAGRSSGTSSRWSSDCPPVRRTPSSARSLAQDCRTEAGTRSSSPAWSPSLRQCSSRPCSDFSLGSCSWR